MTWATAEQRQEAVELVAWMQEQVCDDPDYPCEGCPSCIKAHFNGEACFCVHHTHECKPLLEREPEPKCKGNPPCGGICCGGPEAKAEHDIQCDNPDHVRQTEGGAL